VNLYKNFRVTRWLGYFIALTIVIVIVYSSNSMFKDLEKEERLKVDLLVEAQKILGSDDEIDPQFQLFLLSIIQQNNSIPLIVTDNQKNAIFTRNISDNISNDSLKLKNEILDMESAYKPIPIELGKTKQFLYYKNSILLNKLQYYPLLLIFIVSIFILFTIWYFRNLKQTEESLLWAGMAKETAHQIGTPLSSLIGWIELLKLEENINHEAVNEMELDIHRLSFITERFSKIGSEPELKNNNLIEVTHKTIQYLRSRISKTIEVTFESNLEQAIIPLNEALFSWVLENLIKNAVDAIISNGKIQLKIFENSNYYLIEVSDSGSGISNRKKKDIFKPGYTTKKRGWGLGLSLAKRIIEQYHNGKIYVLKTELNKGTTFRIELKKSTKLLNNS